MPLIPAPPATPDRDTLALRIDRDLHGQLREYAEFLNTTKEYIVSSALRRVFRHDKYFIVWRQRRDAPTTPAPTPASAHTTNTRNNNSPVTLPWMVSKIPAAALPTTAPTARATPNGTTATPNPGAAHKKPSGSTANASTAPPAVNTPATVATPLNAAGQENVAFT